MYGVLALGDSITNAGGELQCGVALQSWALWAARGLGLPYTGYAVDGATVDDVVGEQIPRAERVSALPAEARYHVGCLYVGVNDVRRPEWDPAEFAARHVQAVRWLAARCERSLCVLAPERLGRPRTPPAQMRELNEIVRGAETLLCDLRSFGARNHVMADRIHPTAFGQIAIAERALSVLAADGLPGRIAPATLISWEAPSWPRRLQADWTYAYRAAKRYLPAFERRAHPPASEPTRQ